MAAPSGFPQDTPPSLPPGAAGALSAEVLPDYAELHTLSNFSFLRGASHPEELVIRAKALGYRALALTDECSLAGVVRAHRQAREEGLPLLVGSEFRLAEGIRLLILACNRAGYGNLSALITLARRRGEKGAYQLSLGDLEGLAPVEALPDCLVLWVPDELSPAAWPEAVQWGQTLARRFPGRVWIAAELHAGVDDGEHIERLQRLSVTTGLPVVAAGDVHMHERSRRPLQDVLTALRWQTTVMEAGFRLFPNGERHLRTRLRLGRLYPPAWLAETLEVAARCTFALDELRYEYPDEVVPPGHSPASYLAASVQAGLTVRYPAGVPERVAAQVENELALIAELAYEPYFLTVYDVVKWARQQGILCQGRGSAANSAVCYALGITEVDPARASLLFERFISRERREPPDIDVDFEHQRREEVIQYLYGKYGRERAALTAAVITYRTRSALRDVGRALGFDLALINALSHTLAWWDRQEAWPERFQSLGLDSTSPRVRQWMALAEQLIGFPRHLTQHVGGFILSRGPLSRLVPIENAAMAERTVIQWDKDDIDTLGLMKVDILALGMLSALRRSLDWVSARRGHPFRLQDIPPEDTATYAMIRRADTLGVFQIESRAQMAMLPRLRPRTFYDLVVEVAIVRPGPIQGDMVHPYLRRRSGQEPYDPESMPREIRTVLGRTYGVPIFQEQAMQLAMVAAGFSPGEADQLRRAMGAWRRRGGVEYFREKLISGMTARGHSLAFAQQLFRQIEGFGDYGFPESHAASFALLAYASAWMKCHEPEAFLCGLINSQPMGFYPVSQLVQDARRHGVTVHGVDVRHSEWDCRLEALASTSGLAGPVAVRLGLRLVRGLGEGAGRRLAEWCRTHPPAAWAEMSIPRLQGLVGLASRDMEALARAGALGGLSAHRREALWQATPRWVQGDLLETAAVDVPVTLLAPVEAEELVADYRHLGLTLGRHPLTLLRPKLTALRFLRAGDLCQADHRQLARCAGVVTCRQRPGTASGVIFLTLEDESGLANVVVHAELADRQRQALLQARLLGVYGQIQRDEDLDRRLRSDQDRRRKKGLEPGPGEEAGVVHLVAKRLVDLSALLGELPTESRDFH